MSDLTPRLMRTGNILGNLPYARMILGTPTMPLSGFRQDVDSNAVPASTLTSSRWSATAKNPACDAQTWSLVASKFIVPFVLLHLAIVIFRDAAARKQFQIFVVLTLAY